MLRWPHPDEHSRRLSAHAAFMAAGGWAVIAAVMILARLGLWAFWPDLMVIGLILGGLWLLPGDSKDPDA